MTYDNLSNGHKPNVKWGPLEIGDIRDAVKLSAAFEKYNPEAVIHFASKIVVSESVKEPESYYDNRVNDTKNFLEQMQKHSVKKSFFQAPQRYTVAPKQRPLPNHIPCYPSTPMAKLN